MKIIVSLCHLFLATAFVFSGTAANPDPVHGQDKLVDNDTPVALRGSTNPENNIDASRDMSVVIEQMPNPLPISQACLDTTKGLMYHIFASISKSTGNCLSAAEHESVGRMIRDALNAETVAHLQENLNRIPINQGDDYEVRKTAGTIFKYSLDVLHIQGWLDRMNNELDWTMKWCYPIYAAMFSSDAAYTETFGALGGLHSDHKPHVQWFIGLYNSQCPFIYPN